MNGLRPCPDCGGTGSIWKEKVQIPCSYCSGKKYVGPIADAAERIEVIGDATLIQADCRDIIPLLAGVDAVVCDPPYGVGFSGSTTKHTKDARNGYLSFDDTPENVVRAVVPAIKLCIERFGRVCMTPGLRCMFAYPEPRSVGSIYYPSGANAGPWGFVCSQPIFYYGGDPYLKQGMGSRPNGFSTTEAAEKSDHPCPKPLGQMKWLVNRASLPGELILDPFAGSGTTGVACLKLGRRFIGIEIEPKYFDIACQRIREAHRQPDMLIEAERKPSQSDFLTDLIDAGDAA